MARKKKKKLVKNTWLTTLLYQWAWRAILSSTPMVVASCIITIALLLLLMANIVVTILELEKQILLYVSM